MSGWRKLARSLEKYSLLLLIIIYIYMRSRVNPVAAVEAASRLLGIERLRIAIFRGLAFGWAEELEDAGGAIGDLILAVRRGDTSLIEKIIDHEVVEYSRRVEVYERAIDAVLNTYLIVAFSIILVYMLSAIMIALGILRFGLLPLTIISIGALAVVSVATILYVEKSMRTIL